MSEKVPFEEKEVVIDGIGKVTQVSENTYRRETTIEQAFNAHMENFSGARFEGEQSDALEKRRFLMLMSARQRKCAKTQRLLYASTSVNDLDSIDSDLRRTHAGNMDDLMKDSAPEQSFQEMRDASEKIYKNLMEEGLIITLESGEVVVNPETNVRTVTQGAIDRLRGEGYNVAIVRKPEDDLYMKKLIEDSNIARAAIESGLQDPEFDEGVNDQTDPAVVELAREKLVAATIVFNRLDRELPYITRNDGDHNATVVLDVKAFYDMMDDMKIPTKNVQELINLNSGTIRSQLSLIHGDFEWWAMTLESMDTAVFVPRLYLLFVGQPSPRVVEFSRVMQVYFAVVQILKQTLDFPTEKVIEKRRRQFYKSLAKEIAKHGPQAQDNVKRFEQRKKKAQEWEETNISGEHISKTLTASRKKATLQLRANVEALACAHEVEVMYHAGQLGDLAMREHKPKYDKETVREMPDVHALWYYNTLWDILQTFNHAVIMSYETMIIKMLRDYIPQETWEFWTTTPEKPDTHRTSPITADFVQKMNKDLTEWRDFDGFINETDLLDKELIPNPELDEGFDDMPVCPTQSYSPTLGQMKRFVRDLNTINRIDPTKISKLYAKKKKATEKMMNDSYKKTDQQRKEAQERVDRNIQNNKDKTERKQDRLAQKKGE